MRAACVVALAVTCSVARADAQVDASGFVGFASFGESELGNSWAAEQAPRSSAIVGARAGWLAVPRLVERDWLALSLAVEAELAMATASTGSSALDDGGRRSYFAPVFGWRAHALLRQAVLARRAGVHVLVGGGGATVASSSPFMAKETDPVGYAGIGGTYAITERWLVRLDARLGMMPGRTSTATRVTELHAGVTARFGEPARRRRESRESPEPEPSAVTAAPKIEPATMPAAPRPEPAPPPPPPPTTPAPPAPADPIPAAIPETITRALASAAAVQFEPRRARITTAAAAALRGLLAVLESDPALRIRITGVPDRAAHADLAKRRAEAVKWHLVDQGIAEDRIETVLGDPAAGASLAITLR